LRKRRKFVLQLIHRGLVGLTSALEVWAVFVAEFAAVYSNLCVFFCLG
jgi:hypothetical protein